MGRNTGHSEKILYNYKFLRNFSWDLYFYFNTFRTIQIWFPVKADLSSSSFKLFARTEFQVTYSEGPKMTCKSSGQFFLLRHSKVILGHRHAQKQRWALNLTSWCSLHLIQCSENFVKSCWTLLWGLFARFACVRLFISFQIPHLQFGYLSPGEWWSLGCCLLYKWKGFSNRLSDLSAFFHSCLCVYVIYVYTNKRVNHYWFNLLLLYYSSNL